MSSVKEVKNEVGTVKEHVAHIDGELAAKQK
jgi:hypothetical protein